MTPPKSPEEADSRRENEAGSHFWCTCGQSQNHPYCDGSHAGSGMRPVRREISAGQNSTWGGGKQSENTQNEI